jgi:hypothetical protein
MCGGILDPNLRWTVYSYFSSFPYPGLLEHDVLEREKRVTAQMLHVQHLYSTLSIRTGATEVTYAHERDSILKCHFRSFFTFIRYT